MQLKSGPKVTILDLADAPIIPPLIYNYGKNLIMLILVNSPICLNFAGLPEVDQNLTYYAVKMNRVSRNF